MERIEELKKAVESLSDEEVSSLLNFIKEKKDIIIPHYCCKKDISEMIKSEGLSNNLSDLHFAILKNDLNKTCDFYLTEAVRNKVIETVDRMKNLKGYY